MVKLRAFPEPDELVICTVDTVKNFGVTVSLDEYPGKFGFIHISEVATGWVKYIRDFVREKQKVVCKALRVRPDRQQIDLSLKRVNEHQRRETIQAWKNEQKAERLMNIVAERYELSLEECRKEFMENLVETYGDLFPAFEQAAMDSEIFKEDVLEGQGEEPAWMKHFLEVAHDNISIPFIYVHGFIDLGTSSKTGIQDITGALEAAINSDEDITIRYLGAPTSRIEVKGLDYKEAEEILREAGKRATDFIESRGGEGKFYKEKD